MRSIKIYSSPAHKGSSLPQYSELRSLFRSNVLTYKQMTSRTKHFCCVWEKHPTHRSEQTHQYPLCQPHRICGVRLIGNARGFFIECINFFRSLLVRNATLLATSIEYSLFVYRSALFRAVAVSRGHHSISHGMRAINANFSREGKKITENKKRLVTLGAGQSHWLKLVSWGDQEILVLAFGACNPVSDEEQHPIPFQRISS